MPQTDSRKPLPFVSGLFPSDTPPDEQTAYDLQTKVVGNLFSQGFPALPPDLRLAPFFRRMLQ